MLLTSATLCSCWVQGRSEAQSLADFLGQPVGQLAKVAPIPGAPHMVSGYAVLPPHGHPSAARQCVYLNGRWVKAVPVAKWVLGGGWGCV